MLSNYRYISDADNIGYSSVDVDEDYIYAVTSSKYVKWSRSTLSHAGSAGVVSAACGIALMNSATAAIVSSSTNRVDFVDVTTNTLCQSITTGGADAVNNPYFGPQIAANKALGIAIATTNSNSNLQKIELGTITTITPSGMSGNQGTCVIVKEGTGGISDRWLVGTNDGKVLEIDSDGNQYYSIALPTTPNDGFPPTLQSISGMAFWEPYLYVTSNFGILYVYEYSTGQLKSRYLTSAGTFNNPSNGGSIVVGASGIGYLGSFNSSGEYLLTELDCSNPKPSFETCYINGLSGSNTKTIRIYNKNIYVVTTTTARMNVVILKSDSLVNTTTQTEMHIPEGTQVAGRAIRIRANEIGQACIVLDENISAGSADLNSREGNYYIELAINEDDNKWDIRDFTA